MQTHAPNTNVKVTLPIPQGNFVFGEVSISDENEDIIDTYTMTTEDFGAESYSHIVGAQLNAIGQNSLGLRTVSMELRDDEGLSHYEKCRYYISSPKPLVAGENSLLTFVQALMLIPTLTNLNGWYLASEEGQIAALSESYNALSRFPLNRTFAKQKITEYTGEELAGINSKGALEDFQKAQILHANYLLGGEVEKAMRDNGVMSHSVGESTTFFRTAKPLDYGISSRAYHYISRYISRDVVINRA